jgi:valine--pyruvate aminotransferase
MINWSDFGKKLTSRSGILELMDDLGRAMQTEGEKYMLGGGNPAVIPEMNAVWRRRMEEIMANGDEFERGLANYDTPQGKDSFLASLSGMLRREFGWDLGPRNIAITNGSQSAFFMLFNLLSGELDSGRGEGAGTRSDQESRGRSLQRILLPLMPEYIGYADQGIGHEHFTAVRPKIERIGDHYFKYHVDFEAIKVGEDISAICVSRPTNPTGNVLSDEEIRRLDEMAREKRIPLLIDNAYGTPFPHIIFKEATPIWNENIILGMSLSKIGLPSTRTGIIIAREEIVQAITAVNAIMSLANNTLGQMITRPLIDSGEILSLSRDVVRPFYQEKSRRAQQLIHQFFEGIPYRIHESGGALFLWLWFEDGSVDTSELYQRLKARQVIIVPGKYFVYGLDEPWEHGNQCVRINFGQEDSVVEEGLKRIADEVRRMRSEA